MKTINIIKPFIILLIMTVIAVGATYADTASVVPLKDMRQSLKESIKYPSFAHKLRFQGSVDVVFSVKSDGHLRVRKVYTDNKELAAYIEKEFNKVCCRNFVSLINQYYKVKLTFKLIS